MEVIRLSGYTEPEKISIATRYLLPKQQKNNGLKKGEMELSEGALTDVVRYYTREAGVRNLEREIAKICRKVVKEKVSGTHEGEVQVSDGNLEHYLGVKRHRFGRADSNDRIGHVTGLAWTEVGGDLLTIEAAVIPGKGKLVNTGSLGDVMQESIQAAMTVVRARAEHLGISDPEFYQKNDVHIHVPEGATPKDGPSAGVGMCTALVSALTQVPVRSDVAMTGEITLRGEVLPIGGLKEKLLAALRGGIRLVLIPEENERELSEVPPEITDGLEIKRVKWIDEVLELALRHMPESRSEEAEADPDLVTAESNAKNKGRGNLTKQGCRTPLSVRILCRANGDNEKLDAIMQGFVAAGVARKAKAQLQNSGCLAQLVERRPYKANVGGSIPSAPTSFGGAVVQLVRIPACHAGGRGFESRPLRQPIKKACPAKARLFFV